MGTISDNIKMLRHRYSLTQEQLGMIAGVSDKAVSTWENGVAVPRIGAVRKMSEYFGVPISEILDSSEALLDESELIVMANAKRMQENPSLVRAFEIMKQDPRMAELCIKLSTVDEEDYDFIERVVNKLAKNKR